MKKRNFSKKRNSILELIRSTKVHPTAEWVYFNLKPVYPNISLATVYRNISDFKKDGSIISVGVVNGQERLDGNNVPHPHFICSSCGCVLDVNIPNTGVNLDDIVSKDHNINIDYHEIVFHGTCSNCLSKNQEI